MIDSIVVGDLTIDLTPEYLSAEARLRPPQKTYRNLPVGEHLESLGHRPMERDTKTESRWIHQRFAEAVDAWKMYGEPILRCPHLAGGRLPDEIIYWFVRYPDSFLCVPCGEALILSLSKQAGVTCDACRDPGYLKAMCWPAPAVVHVAILCHVCFPEDD